MKVVGVDGCRGGWVAVVLDLERRTLEPELHRTLAELIDAHADAGAIGIDMPIGLSPTGTRQCDVEARKLLGPGRASSVFPPPPFAILGAATYAEAAAMSRNLIGKGVPKQTFAMFPKLIEANHAISPDIQDRVFEIHPEVSFWALAGRPMVHNKRRPAGYEERQALLEAAIGVALPSRREASGWERPSQPDDLLDATVGAWTARRVVEGRAGKLPGFVERGSLGLRMEMVY